MLEHVGVRINEVGAILLSVGTVVPSVQKISKIRRSLKCSLLRLIFATRDVEGDEMSRHFERCVGDYLRNPPLDLGGQIAVLKVLSGSWDVDCELRIVDCRLSNDPALPTNVVLCLSLVITSIIPVLWH